MKNTDKFILTFNFINTNNIYINIDNLFYISEYFNVLDMSKNYLGYLKEHLFKDVAVNIFNPNQ